MPPKHGPARIHLTAVGSPADKALSRLGVRNNRQLVTLVQKAVGADYRVTASEKLIFAPERDTKGGRNDDAQRAREIQRVLADDNVAAFVTLRGGAWFTRLLDAIGWDMLKRRKRMIYFFGFSEMTPLVAIAGQYPKAVGLYDLGPAFLYGGLKRWAQKNLKSLTGPDSYEGERAEAFAAGWASARFAEAFDGFFADVVRILDGRGSKRVPAGRLLAGTLPRRQQITLTGGNLSLILAMIGSPFASAVDPAGKWLALEDLNEPPDNLDRMLAGLKLAGFFERAKGIILGDFHNRDEELSEAIPGILKHHLAGRRLPIIQLDNFGHIYPLAPLPMHREVTLHCQPAPRGRARVRLDIPWHQWTR